MKNRRTVTKRNSITEASQKEKGALGRAHIKRPELTRRTRSKALGSAQAGGAITPDTIKRDLNQRKAKNQKRMKSERALERFVLEIRTWIWVLSTTCCLKHLKMSAATMITLCAGVFW